MQVRQSTRITLHSFISYVGDREVGEGLISNLSNSGCHVETHHHLRRGDFLTLRILIPKEEHPLDIDLSAVRWTNGPTFGVEFIRTLNDAQDRILQLMTTHDPANITFQTTFQKVGQEGSNQAPQ